MKKCVNEIFFSEISDNWKQALFSYKSLKIQASEIVLVTR